MSSPQITSSQESVELKTYQFERNILPWFKNIVAAGRLALEEIHVSYANFIYTQKDLDSEKIISQIRLKKEEAKEKLDIAEASLLSIALDHVKQVSVQYSSPELSVSPKKINEEYRRAQIKKSTSSSENARPKGCEPTEERIENYRLESQHTHMKITRILKTFIDQLKSGITSSSVTNFLNEIKNRVIRLEGTKRFQIIHSHELWNPKPVNPIHHYMSFESESNQVTGDSIFLPLGPGKSSQAPRMSDRSNALTPNFFRSLYYIDNKQVLDVSRSAITVEFDQEEEERKESNKTLVQQVLDANLEIWINQLSADEILAAQNSKNPLKFNFSTVNLLTPDVLRDHVHKNEFLASLAKIFTDKLSGASADNERLLSKENLEAHQDLGRFLYSYTLRNEKGEPITDEKGQIIKIWIDPQINYFNIPMNGLQHQLPSFLTDVKELADANKQSWGILENHIKNHIGDFDKHLMDIYKEVKIDKQIYANIIKKTKQSFTLRKNSNIMQWQNISDEIVQEIKKLETNKNIDRSFIDIIKKRQRLNDLYCDVKELFEKGNPSLDQMDQNNSALAARLIILIAELKDHRVNFGCRSGKDRTGIVDIEMKLLMTEYALKGRFLSYKEQERTPHINDHRQIMYLQSGNCTTFIEATMGASLGLNLDGCSLQPYKKNREKEKFKETLNLSKGFAPIASRPISNKFLDPAFAEEWKYHKKQSLIIHAQLIKLLKKPRDIESRLYGNLKKYIGLLSNI